MVPSDLLWYDLIHFFFLCEDKFYRFFKFRKYDLDTDYQFKRDRKYKVKPSDGP